MEIEISGHTYRLGRIDARSQFHIVRRLAPVIGEIAPALQGEGKGGMEALPVLASAVAKLSDADADYVVFGLLKVVARKQGQGLGWAPVSTGTQMMYDDITLPDMLRLAYEVFVMNMSSFFPGLPSGSTAANPKASDPSNG